MRNSANYQDPCESLLGISFNVLKSSVAKLEVEDSRDRRFTTYRPRSVSDIFRLITYIQISAENGHSTKTQRFRNTIAFRGESNASRRLLSKLERHAESAEGHIYQYELSLLRNFQKYGRESIAPFHYSLDHVAFAQHHHLNTRLLDWSYSPLTALHFLSVSHNNIDDDGVLYAVELRKAKRQYPEMIQEHMALSSALVPTSETIDIAVRRFLRAHIEKAWFSDYVFDRLKADSSDWSGDQVRSIQKSLRESMDGYRPTHWRLYWIMLLQITLPVFKSKEGASWREKNSYILFYEAPAIDSRLVAQSSVFSLNSVLDPQVEIAKDICHREKLGLVRLLVNPQLKKSLRHILDAYGVNERAIMGGPDGISEWLNRHYRD